MNGGILDVTADGGATWKTLGVPAAGPFRFITPTDGWLDGGANAEAGPGVYVTRDGGKDWDPITIKAPTEFGARIYPDYRLPDFANRDSGSMLVTFSKPNDESPRLVLFRTGDSGRSWTLRGSAEEGGTSWQPTYAGNEWVALGCPSREFTALHVAGEVGSQSKSPKTASEIVCGWPGGGFRQISFADDIRGWALLFGGEVVATSDAGQTWKRITPPGTAVARAVRAKSVGVSVQVSGVSQALPQSHLDGSSSNVSAHLGFDKFPVIPKTSDMQTWMISSPFYDVGIYLPGSKNKSSDPNLTPGWISAYKVSKAGGSCRYGLACSRRAPVT